MRLIASVIGLAAIGLIGFGATFVGSQTNADLLALCRQSRVEALQAGRIINRNQSYSSDSKIEAPKVLAYLRGGPRPAASAVTTHMGRHLVAGEDLCRALENEPPPTTTTTTTTTTVTTTEPPPTEPPPPGGLTLQQIDGGPGYFSNFSNSLPANVFPITAWIRPVHDQAQVDQYKDFGLTLFTGLENPELTNESLLRSNGLKALVQASERTRFNDIGSETAGWQGGDEIDMSSGGEFKCLNGQFQQELAGLGIGANGINGDNRMVHYNFGKGLGIWYREGFRTDAQNQCYVNHPFLDLVTVDVYYNTDTSTGQWHRRGWAYGEDVKQLRAWDAADGARKPVGITVELGPPGFGETFAPQPAEVRSAVWHSIIAGARLVQYFDHNFGTSTSPPTCHGSTIRGECFPQIRAMAKSVNEQIQSLAPVLNSPFVTSGWTLSGSPTRGMVKWDGQNFYVFLGTENGGNASFSMPCIGNATASVLGESRNVTVGGGTFTDSFADKNAVHIYQVSGGSRCGL